MEDIRCPVCKKSNPPGEDTCLFCGADLIPAALSISDTSPGDEVNEPQWLKDFREKTGTPDSALEDDSSKGTSSGADDRTPDWLRRIRDHNDQKLAGRATLSDSLVDKSSGVSPDAGQPPLSGEPLSSNPEPVNGSGLQDWLNKLHRLENPKNNPPDSQSFENTDLLMGESIPDPESGEPGGVVWENDSDGSEKILSDSLMAPQDIQKTPTGVDGEGLLLAVQPEQITEDSLTVEIGEYNSEPLDMGDPGPGLAAVAAGTVISDAEPESPSNRKDLVGRLSSILGGIGILKVHKAKSQESTEQEEKDIPQAQEIGSILDGADEEVGIPGDEIPEAINSDLAGRDSAALLDSQVEEGQEEIALADSLLDEPKDSLSSAEQSGSKELLEAEASTPDLPGSIQSEEFPAEFTPASSSLRSINLTDQQRAQAVVLQDLLSDELEPQVPPVKRSKIPNVLMRWIVGIVLIAALIYTIITAGETTLPSFYIPPMPQQLSFYNQVESLPQKAPVLVAFDYEAAFSGEIRPMAINVIEHLKQKSATIAAVSIVPAGPILAEDVYAAATPGNTLLQQTDQGEFINLGYLPGGLVSLREFALQPVQASTYGLQSAADGLSPWSQPALQGISRLSDFSMVIVISDSLETGRAWIEQVQPTLGKIPLLLVTSAQAGPMLNPYLFSGQANGVISGFPGNLVYEQLLNKGTSDPTAFLAYRTGMYILLVSMIIGIFLKIFSPAPTSPPQEKGNDDVTL